jgi:hypothetical protein
MPEFVMRVTCDLEALLGANEDQLVASLGVASVVMDEEVSR